MNMTEQKENAADAPLLFDKAGRGVAEQSTFRGKPIEWLTVQTTKTVVMENAIGDSEVSERPARKNHFILYGGNQYKREEFYQMAFP